MGFHDGSQVGNAFSGSIERFFDGVEDQSRSSDAADVRFEHADLGHGTLWRVAAKPHSLQRSPVVATDRTARTFAVLLVVEGQAEITQADRACKLDAGQFTLVDGLQPFNADMPSAYKKIIFQLPRQAVVSRHIGIESRTALPNDVERPGNRLFRDFVLSVSRSADSVSFAERRTLLSASIEMLGLVESESAAHNRLPRLERAIAEIEINLGDPDLSPDWVARRLGLSRRHTDAIFELTGMSVSAQIWERRLVRSATELASSRNAECKIIDVAFSCGFRDPAHFSRAFRKRFGLTPSQWRMHGGKLIN
jgi:AraC family transcriptional regulator, positive regulator of tynA and feaB